MVKNDDKWVWKEVLLNKSVHFFLLFSNICSFLFFNIGSFFEPQTVENETI